MGTGGLRAHLTNLKEHLHDKKQREHPPGDMDEEGLVRSAADLCVVEQIAIDQ